MKKITRLFLLLSVLCFAFSLQAQRYSIEGTLIADNTLNRNVGINRTADVNFIQEEVIRSLGQYFMLGFTYSLKPLGGSQRGIVIQRG